MESARRIKIVKKSTVFAYLSVWYRNFDDDTFHGSEKSGKQSATNKCIEGFDMLKDLHEGVNSLNKTLLT